MLMKKLCVFFSAMVLTLVSFTAMAQSSVSGKVSDENGDPIPGASIVLKGNTSVYALTDTGGQFSLKAPSDGVLLVDCLGFIGQEVAINGRKIVNVVLEQDSQLLDETIVVAFGTTTKEAFTGSAAVVKAEELQKRQTTNVANALVGNVPGLQMRGQSGAPGAGAGSMNIRGIASMYASTDPLIIVDGAPYSASLSNIPQSDIESVTVLKDAASAALYGARGAAGVIIVTTKKGRSGDAVVNVDARYGFNTRAIQDYDVITDPAAYYEAYYAQLFNYSYYGQNNTVDYANNWANTQMINHLGYQVFTTPVNSETGLPELLIGKDGKINPNATLGYALDVTDESGKILESYWLQPDNWTNEAYKKALRKEYNVSVTGGNDRASFYASVGYLNEDGIIEFSGYERISARLKAEYKAKNWLKVGGNVGFVNSVTTSNPNMSASQLGSTNLMYYTSNIAPIYPIYVRGVDAVVGADGKVTYGQPYIRTDENGNPQYDYGRPGQDYPVARAFLQTGNPLGANRYNVSRSNGNQLNGNMFAEFQILPSLTFNITTTAILGLTNQTFYDNGLYGPKVGVHGELDKYSSVNLRTNNLQTLNYVKEFGKSSLNITAGHEYYKTNGSSLEAVAQGAYTPEILEINAFAKKLTSYSSSSMYNVEGYFVSAQYNLDQKYYLSASFRRDATSYFAKENRWGNFWSVGGAWILSKEKLFESSDVIDILKLKASIGQQGNDGVGSYCYTDLYTITTSGEYTMAPEFARIGNPNITWETTTNTNVGLEFSLYKGRLSGGIDFYNKISDGQLFWLSVAESVGSRGYYGNMGKIQNKGIELSLNADLIRSRDIVWSANFNIATNSDKILTLPESKMVDPENGVRGFTESSRWMEEGGSMYAIFRKAYAGVNEQGEALYWIDDDLEGAVNRPGTNHSRTTTVWSDASYYNFGSSLPKAFGGFGTSLRLGHLDFSATFDYQIGGLIYDSRYAGYMSPCVSSGDAGSAFHKDWIKSWSPNNTSSNIPRWQYTDRYTTSASDRFLTDASYLNFQSFTVGYTLLKSIKGISKIRVYAAGENLGFWSARKGLDPRYSFTGTASLAVYSPVRTVSGGVQITF